MTGVGDGKICFWTDIDPRRDRRRRVPSMPIPIVIASTGGSHSGRFGSLRAACPAPGLGEDYGSVQRLPQDRHFRIPAAAGSIQSPPFYRDDAPISFRASFSRTWTATIIIWKR